MKTASPTFNSCSRRAPPEHVRRENEKLAADDAERWQVAFEAKGNPIYVMKAIAAFGVVNRDRLKAGEPELPLPTWITDQLYIWAQRIEDIANGLDWRDAPKPFGLITVPEDNPVAAGAAVARAKARNGRHRRRDGRIIDGAATFAASEVLPALGFGVGRTANRFVEFWRDQDRWVDAATVQFEQSVNGLTTPRAIARAVNHRKGTPENPDPLDAKVRPEEARTMKRRIERKTQLSRATDAETDT